MTSAYIHIPFCEHICFYCDFNKVFIEGQPVDEYIEALLKLIHQIQLKPFILVVVHQRLYLLNSSTVY